MARTRRGNALTAAHRAQQLRIRAAVQRRLMAAFPLLDHSAIDLTVAAWLDASMAVIEAGGNLSQRAATNYLTAFRAAEGVPGEAVIREATLRGSVRPRLLINGPSAIKRATALGGRTPAATSDAALSRVLGVGGRSAIDQGTDTLLASVRADSAAGGWVRVASGSACAFCGMLASRGAVYKSESSVDFETHGNCACTAEPAFGDSYELPPTSKQWMERWDSVAAASPTGHSSLNRFRRNLAAGL